jgi:hypothetical protein
MKAHPRLCRCREGTLRWHPYKARFGMDVTEQLKAGHVHADCRVYHVGDACRLQVLPKQIALPL